MSSCTRPIRTVAREPCFYRSHKVPISGPQSRCMACVFEQKPQERCLNVSRSLLYVNCLPQYPCSPWCGYYVSRSSDSTFTFIRKKCPNVSIGSVSSVRDPEVEIFDGVVSSTSAATMVGHGTIAAAATAPIETAISSNASLVLCAPLPRRTV